MSQSFLWGHSRTTWTRRGGGGGQPKVYACPLEEGGGGAGGRGRGPGRGGGGRAGDRFVQMRHCEACWARGPAGKAAESGPGQTLSVGAPAPGAAQGTPPACSGKG